MATEKFHYKAESGASIALPRFGQVPSGLIRKVRKESPVEQMFSILEGVCDAKTLDAIDLLDSAELNVMVGAWQEDAKVSPGESSASSTS